MFLSFLAEKGIFLEADLLRLIIDIDYVPDGEPIFFCEPLSFEDEGWYAVPSVGDGSGVFELFHW
jgi:hypothetical protein